jgi:hypothetical protein
VNRRIENGGFGDFLLLMAERLGKAESGRETVLDCLDQVNEAWDRQLDPATDFEAYAALRFCQAMRRALSRPQGQPLAD